MIGVLFLIILFFLVNQVIFNVYQKKHKFLDKRKMNLLYLYHLIFFGVYLWYAYNNPSDSKGYYNNINIHTGSWFELFGTDTDFIDFLAYPLRTIGFSYEMLMLAFAWLGYLGFFYAYLFFREKIPVKIKVFKSIDLLTLILFLPNMHFWTASLGKGSTIFFGLMLFTYGIVKPGSRILLLILSSFIIYHIRPHVFMFVAVGAVAGYMSGKEKIPFWQKTLVFVSLIGTLILVQDQILAVMGLQGSENLIEDFQTQSEERSEDLSDAGSGVDMSSYPLPLKLFTFWFRPLFIDAPNVLGLIVSAENLIYLLLFFKILKKDFIKFIKKSPAVVKMSLVIFFTTSLAMTFVMSNLGIIMRQKSMVMYYIFFVIYYYLAQKKYDRILKIRRRKAKRKENVISPV
ncbi:conserved hypothetical protein, membrane [Christiangramia forsetii KT0803]|uniref:Uncharacterized protein n=3 Tax=Christiangramia forsetii TaxID=411153 RepID=A0M2X0_CHRFK|nr:hypothetical protein GCM10011532_08460 [Christiangramia forsetii]CAL66965.1 conserved hypothetical protein, membrane [Christiangramia forsetii KT0803]